MSGVTRCVKDDAPRHMLPFIPELSYNLYAGLGELPLPEVGHGRQPRGLPNLLGSSTFGLTLYGYTRSDMTFISAIECAKVELRIVQQGQFVENVFHCKKSGGFDAATLNTLAGIFKTWWVAHVASTVPVGVVLIEVVATALDDETSPGITYTTDLPIGGTSGTDELPMNVTVACTMKTGLRGRSYTGRIYHIGLPPVAVVGSVLSSGAHTALLAAYESLRNTLETASTPLQVVSYRHANAPRPFAVATQVTNFVIDSITDSQRRRLPGRGA